MEHTLEFHKQSLSQLCRICTNMICKTPKQKAARPTKKVENYKERIEKCFALDLSQDGSDTHSENICDSCYRFMLNAQRRSGSVYDKSMKMSETNMSVWVTHKRHSSVESCLVCQKVAEKSKGGRPNKVKKGRPNIIPKYLPFNRDKADIFDHFFDTIIFIENKGYIAAEKNPTVSRNLTCSLCNYIYSTHCFKTNCQPFEHYFCSLCLTKAYKVALTSHIDCPVCQTAIEYSTVSRGDTKFISQLTTSEVKCEQCGKTAPFDKINDHICQMETHSVDENETRNETRIDAEGSPVSPPVICKHSIDVQTTPTIQQPTVKHILDCPDTDPLSNIEEKVHTKLVRRKLNMTNSEGVIICKTRGQVGYFIKAIVV